MKFGEAIELYVADMWAQGRFNSKATETGYRYALNCHQDDVGNRDPVTTGREDVKRTLKRWSHPNSQRKHRSVLVSFYDWLVEEGHREYNPAKQTRRPKKRPPSVYRMTKEESLSMLMACETPRERRIVHLGILAGLRSAELRGLQGRHFERPGFIWVEATIAKGKRERWVPVIRELAPTFEEIRQNVGLDEYVLPAQRMRDPGINKQRIDYRLRPCSRQVLRTVVMEVARRAGIKHHIFPHLLRHAYASHVARQVGAQIAQALLGHASLATTQSYLEGPSLDELAEVVSGLEFGMPDHLSETPPPAQALSVPVEWSDRSIEPEVMAWLDQLAPTVQVYIDHFRELSGAV